MSEAFDPYVVLGVTRNATQDEIRAAFRVAASRCHPDRPGGSTEAMTDVNMAYKILSDPEMRSQFDRTGGTASMVPLDVKACELIVGMLKQVIRGSSPYDNMITIVTSGLYKQRDGCRAQRATTVSQLADLRLRVGRLKGPPDNFIETLLLQEIARGEDTLPVYDEDELVIARAIDLLKDFTYGDGSILYRVNSAEPWSKIIGPA